MCISFDQKEDLKRKSEQAIANGTASAFPRKARRGFAAMSPEKQREIASKGGKSVPAEKRSFSQDRHLAHFAGSLGGVAVQPGRRSFSTNRALASQAGRKGGITRGENIRARKDFLDDVQENGITRARRAA
jgi:general stress protein YciG